MIRKEIGDALKDLEHSGLWKQVGMHIESKHPKFRWFSLISYIYVDECLNETKLNCFERRRLKKIIRKIGDVKE